MDESNKFSFFLKFEILVMAFWTELNVGTFVYSALIGYY